MGEELMPTFEDMQKVQKAIASSLATSPGFEDVNAEKFIPPLDPEVMFIYEGTEFYLDIHPL
jgi:hypothetical protein